MQKECTEFADYVLQCIRMKDIKDEITSSAGDDYLVI